MIVSGTVISSKGGLQSIVSVEAKLASVVVCGIVSVVVIVVVERFVVSSEVEFVMKSIFKMVILNQQVIKRNLTFVYHIQQLSENLI